MLLLLDGDPRVLIAAGAALAVFGGYVWHRGETSDRSTVVHLLGACIVAASAAVFILPGVARFLADEGRAPSRGRVRVRVRQVPPPLWVCILLIFVGSVSYTIAAYAHLKLASSWTFLAAFTIALPLILFEYQFSIRGNHYAHMRGLNAVQITLITMCFYFANAWALNKFVLRRNAVIWWRELLAFACIIAAFALSAGGGE